MYGTCLRRARGPQRVCTGICMNAEEETLQETTQGAERGRAENATWVTSRRNLCAVVESHISAASSRVTSCNAPVHLRKCSLARSLRLTHVMLKRGCILFPSGLLSHGPPLTIREIKIWN